VIGRGYYHCGEAHGVNMYNRASIKGRVRYFGHLELGRHYTITYIFRSHPELPHTIHLEPGNIWTTLPTSEYFSQQEITLTNEGWFELECFLSGRVNGVPIANIIRKKSGVCPR
jgi:hypothetical protein